MAQHTARFGMKVSSGIPPRVPNKLSVWNAGSVVPFLNFIVTRGVVDPAGWDSARATTDA